MWEDYPWKESITQTAAGTIPLIDSVQDYPAVAPNIIRMLKAWIKRTDTIPPQVRDLDVKRDLAIDLYPKSYVAIRAVSLQEAIGKVRLESAVNVPSGMQMELQFDYKLNPAKVTSLNDGLWFDDRYAVVALEGLLYWVYKLSDDTRAGSAQTDAAGRTIGYGGQMGIYRAALNRMRMAVDSGYTEQLFPAEPMGEPRDSNALSIFGW